MGDETNMTSATAIAAATAPIETTAEQMAELAAAQAKAAELIKLPLPKLKAALVGLTIFELARVLEAEKGEGEGKTRDGALELIERQAQKLAEEAAAAMEGQANDDGARPPADDAAAGGNADNAGAGDVNANANVNDGNGGGDSAAGGAADRGQGGAVSMILTAEELADVTGPAAADAIAATVEAIAPAPAPRAPQIEDESADWTNAEVLAHVLAAGAAVIFARRDMVHLELVPIVLPAQAFAKAYDGERVLLVEDVKLSGLGLARSLPIEEAWLVLDTEDGPVLVRRCEMSGELNLDPGREVGFGPRALVF